MCLFTVICVQHASQVAYGTLDKSCMVSSNIAVFGFLKSSLVSGRCRFEPFFEFLMFFGF